MILYLLLACLATYTPAMPDFDRDGDVDQSDWGSMQVALNEPHMPFSACDLNMDGAVDQRDVEEFMKHKRRPQ